MERAAVRLDSDHLPGGPWVYARRVVDDGGAEDGTIVEILDSQSRFVGHGLFNSGSDVRVRTIARGRRNALDKPGPYLRDRLAAALRLRKRTLRLPEVSDAWRAVHAEGDDLSGLIVDHFAGTLVVEHHALGWWRLREELEWALLELEPAASIVHRVPNSARRAESFELREEPPPGEERWIQEYGLPFPVVPGAGHKTGWFCDQRENRQRLAALASGRHVLDLCCNAGGFSLAAAAAGARSVTGVDLDEVALERATRAADRARLPVEWIHDDAFRVLRRVAQEPRRPGLVILDPHKLIAGRRQMEEGLRRYLDLNALALAAVAPGGLCCTFSCSGALDLAAFLGMVFRAARRADRSVRLLEILGAGPDHPQRPDFPRSRYLKGALLAVD